MGYKARLRPNPVTHVGHFHSDQMSHTDAVTNVSVF